jgi:hypothetical protein
MNTIMLMFGKYILYPVIIGIISTICYVLFFDKLLKQIIVPWYFSSRYKSTIIGGIWKGGIDPYYFIFNIKQVGDRINGTIEVETRFQGKATASNSYIFNGEIRDGFLLITHRESDRKRFGFGSFVFRIIKSGDELKGGVVFVVEGDAPEIAVKNSISLSRQK